MNLLHFPTLPRDPSIAAATREAEIEAHIDNAVRNAQAFRRLIRETLTNAETFTDLSFVPGYDRETILGVLKDWMSVSDAEVERWAEDNFVRESE